MFSSAFEFLRDFPAAQRAIVAGVAVAIVCSLLSVFVVLKRMAFIGQGISHAGYGAAGTALLLGLAIDDPRYDALVLLFCLATGLLIGAISRHKRVNEDSAIGILLVASMAWGVFMKDLSSAFRGGGAMHWPWYNRNIPVAPADFEKVLFGSILNTSPAQAIILVIVAIVIALILWAFFKEIVFFAFDETSSRVFGVRGGMIHYLLQTLLAVTVVLTMRLAGVLMAGAILVIPGATAMMLSDRLSRVLAISVGVGAAGVTLGLLLSFELGWASPGPCIVGMLCAFFGAAWVWKGLRIGAARAA